jgi:threonylcarbamoyladenosine tRNA methylthiotransferase MtaB
MFPYSSRKRTRAALYPNKVASDVISRRKHELLRLAEKTSFELRQKFVGQKMEVLLENSEEGRLSGHTSNFLRVFINGGAYKPNDLVEVTLVANEPDGLIGVVNEN